MAKEKENKDVEIIEDVEEDSGNKELEIAKEMAKIFADEMKKVKEEEKEEMKKEIANKVIKANRIKVVDNDVKCGSFKNIREAHNFAKTFVPKFVLEKFMNEKALTTYQNIATDADGGSFDPIAAQGLLADSVERRNSYVEDTLQVRIFNSVGTFIDHTSDATAYMIGEGVAGTESKPGNTTRTITQKKIMVICPVTNEVFRFGSLADIANETLDSMSRAISTKKQHLIFVADGTADTTDGSITGTIPAIEAVSGNDTIYTVNGQWDALDNNDVSNIVANVASYADAGNFAWYCHKNMWGFLEGLARTLNGNSYLIQVGQRPIPFLFGYPVKFVNSMPSAFAEDEKGLLFGDLKAMTATGSDQNTYVDISSDFYFSADVTSLRAIQHMGVNVYQPGTDGAPGSVIAVKFSEVT